MDLDGTLLRCYDCGGVAAVTGPPGADLVEDRAQWPDVGCPVTDGCGGTLQPEALN